MIMTAAWCILAAFAAADQPFLETALIFDPEQDDRGHVHASCIVACPNGDLRVVWYENGPALPPPYFDKEKDKSADVRIAGSRKPAGADAWESPFVMVDTFGVSDNNPCMVVDNEDRLWLFHAILLGVPESSWGSALLQYRIASDYARPGPPRWDRESALVVHLAEFEDPAEAEHADPQLRKGLNLMRGWLKDPFKRRLGWMPRAHPLIQADGALLLPLANENFTIAAMAFTRDAGETWTFSRAVPGLGLEQPSVVEFPDGAMTAFFRNDRPQKRIVRSDSTDGGVTWGPVTPTELPHPNAGIEAIVLRSGALAMIYNDSEEERDRLAVSISEDRGQTWRWTRHIENAPGKRFDYPSLVQTPDGALHATYSLNTKTIKYARFNEAWVREGE